LRILLDFIVQLVEPRQCIQAGPLHELVDARRVLDVSTAAPWLRKWTP
jgi:hypothetical protein